MPIHEYECPQCQWVEERLFRNTESIPEYLKCPQCSFDYSEKIMSQNTFKLKGDCWEKDGYHRKGKVPR